MKETFNNLKKVIRQAASIVRKQNPSIKFWCFGLHITALIRKGNDFDVEFLDYFGQSDLTSGDLRRFIKRATEMGAHEIGFEIHPQYKDEFRQCGYEPLEVNDYSIDLDLATMQLDHNVPMPTVAAPAAPVTAPAPAVTSAPEAAPVASVAAVKSLPTKDLLRGQTAKGDDVVVRQMEIDGQTVTAIIVGNLEIDDSLERCKELFGLIVA